MSFFKDGNHDLQAKLEFGRQRKIGRQSDSPLALLHILKRKGPVGTHYCGRVSLSCRCNGAVGLPVRNVPLSNWVSWRCDAYRGQL